LGQAGCGKTTLLEALSIRQRLLSPELQVLNREIHSSDDSRESVAFTRMPFTSPPHFSSNPTPLVMRTAPIEEYKAEVAEWTEPRAMTLHELQPIWNVTEEGLSIVELSSAFDSVRWSFVASTLAVSDCDIAIFVIDRDTPLDPENHVTRIAWALLSANKRVVFVVNRRSEDTDATIVEISQKMDECFGQSLDNIFDFKSDTNGANLFRSHLIGQLMQVMDQKAANHHFYLSQSPISDQSAHLLRLVEEQFVIGFDVGVDWIISYITAFDDILAAPASSSDPQVVSDQLNTRLLTIAYSILCNSVNLLLLERSAFLIQQLKISKSTPILQNYEISGIHSALYTWFFKAVPHSKKSSVLVPGVVASASGVSTALTALALSFSGPMVFALAAGAALIGASAGYIFRPNQPMLPNPTESANEPTMSWKKPTERQVREFVWKNFKTRLADRGETYMILKVAVMNTFRNVVLAHQADQETKSANSASILSRSPVASSSQAQPFDTAPRAPI
jgi:hypothetical protein